MATHLPVILIEGVLIFGGVLAFGWWQLRSVKRDQDRSARERALREVQDAASATPGDDPR